MRYTFSAEFLKVTQPETSFGKAWEALCYELLAAEHGINGLQRLNAPDSGIDILRRTTATAIQCKSDERGTFGSLSATESVKSLHAAEKARPEIDWQNYRFATNANYTGSAVKTIMAEGASLGIESNNIDFLGPEYWNKLCERYFDHVQDRFDFRVTVTEEQVIEAFRKARYFDKYVNQYEKLIDKGDFILTIKNNWTPITLEFPFSPDLTVENCVDAVQELLGVSLKWTNFSDLGTSTSPSISLTVDQKGQKFKQTIGEVKAAHPDKDLVFWITLVWKDKKQDEGQSIEELLSPLDRDDKLRYLAFMRYDDYKENRSTLDEPHRRKKTLQRAESLVQTMIWGAARKIKYPEKFTHPS